MSPEEASQASKVKQGTNLPTSGSPDIAVDVHALNESAPTAAALPYAKDAPVPLHPAAVGGNLNKRSMIIWSTIIVCIVVPAIVGPVYYMQVVVPRDRAAAEAAARAAIKPPVPPLPPMVPVTQYFYDDFNSLNKESWSFQLGNGLDRGWNFHGFGNNELECYTEDPANVDVIQDPTNTTNNVLRLQAVYQASPISCTDRLPYNQTTTSWTSGSIRSKSKRLFRAPQSRLPNTTSTDSCTSLYIEARVRLPAVRGTSARLLLLPEPQNQTLGAPRCELSDECGAYGIWPASGEVDIMGHKDVSTKVSQAIQFLEGAHAWRTAEYDLIESALNWHTYKLEWNCDFLRWYVDDTRVYAVSRLGTPWPFDQPFYLGIGYAVGGTLVDLNVEQRDSSLLVDYVRAWYANRDPPTANIAVNETAEIGSSTTAAGGNVVNARRLLVTSSSGGTASGMAAGEGGLPAAVAQLMA